VIIMVGGNDLKAAYNRTPYRIAVGVGHLIDICNTIGGGLGTTYMSPKVLLICPPPLSPLIEQGSVWHCHTVIWRQGRVKAEAAKVVPWLIAGFRGPGCSVCKGHWLEIRHGLKTCYAQWEDVGPFCTDLAGYVFGDDRPSPNVNHGAGIDVSPAV
jgi:hypothetical protein